MIQSIEMYRDLFSNACQNNPHKSKLWHKEYNAVLDHVPKQNIIKGLSHIENQGQPRCHPWYTATVTSGGSSTKIPSPLSHGALCWTLLRTSSVCAQLQIYLLNVTLSILIAILLSSIYIYHVLQKIPSKSKKFVVFRAPDWCTAHQLLQNRTQAPLGQ